METQSIYPSKTHPFFLLSKAERKMAVENFIDTFLESLPTDGQRKELIALPICVSHQRFWNELFKEITGEGKFLESLSDERDSVFDFIIPIAVKHFQLLRESL